MPLPTTCTGREGTRLVHFECDGQKLWDSPPQTSCEGCFQDGHVKHMLDFGAITVCKKQREEFLVVFRIPFSFGYCSEFLQTSLLLVFYNSSDLMFSVDYSDER